MQRKSQTLEGLRESSDIEGILRKHHAFQRLLEPYKVVNPYAEELFYEDDRLQARRDQPKFLNLCKTVAFLNQMKKTVKRCENIEYIEVDKSDIEQAVNLASEILGVSLDDLGAPAGMSENHLVVDFTLTDKSGKVLWQWTLDKEDWIVQWIYARMGHDCILFTSLYQAGMNEALTNLAEKMREHPELFQ